MIMRSNTWRDGRNAPVVIFDEGDTNLGCCDGADDPVNATTNSGGGHVVTVVIRNHDTDPLQDPTPYNHHSLVATLFTLPSASAACSMDNRLATRATARPVSHRWRRCLA